MDERIAHDPIGGREGKDPFQLLVESVQDYAIFMLDPQGYIQSWNAGARRLKGYEASEIVGKHFRVFYPAEAKADGWPEEMLRRAVELGHVEDEGWRVRKDGTRFWASVVITSLHEGGTLKGFAKVTRDLSERRAHEQALRHSEEQLRLLVGGVKDYAIFMLDPSGTVLTWNAGAENIHGYCASEAVGLHFSRFFTAEDVAAGIPESELDQARHLGRADAEGWRVRKGGETFWAGGVVTPLWGPSGELRGFAEVTRDLSDQRRLADLERTSRRMEEFLAILGHELRNPLAPLRNAVHIMTLGKDLPPYMIGVRDMVDRQVRQLTRLVDDLLDVARISTGKLPLQIAHLDLRAVVHAAVETVRPDVSAKRQRLYVEMPGHPLTVQGDEARLTQALQNLLSNASRYTPESGEIRLCAQAHGNSVLVTVSDNGIGLTPDSLERIFELFAQERVAAQQSNAGLGIGLGIARKVIRLHGGSLVASSPGLGKGSTFTVELPLAEQGETFEDRTEEDIHSAGHRVLVIDDNVDSADSMVSVLRMIGHSAEAAYRGAEGLALATKFEPDLVLLDLNMPELNGFEVLKQLRKNFGSRIKVIAMTGYGAGSDQRAALAAGFDMHLTKPVAVEEVQRVLDGLSTSVST